MVAAGAARFASAVSEHPDAAHAVAEAAGAVLDRVGAAADVAFLFVSGSHTKAMADIAEATEAILRPGALAGATAVAVIGGAEEIEDRAAVSVWAGHTGAAEAVRLEVVHSSDGTAVIGMPDDAADGRRTLVLLADPFSFPTTAFVEASNEQYPDLAIVGGSASSSRLGATRLIVQGGFHPQGAVGILLPPELGETTVVAQGCRPVGEPFVVTASEGDVVHELGSQPAHRRLQSVIDEADDHTRALLSRGLHVGLAIDESADDLSTDGFLIRGVRGTDASSGGLRIGGPAPIGTTLQFHVRDAASARLDLDASLAGVDAQAALVFTGNARGTRLFESPDRDAAAVCAAVDGGAVAGMSCAAELAPVAGQNQVHALSASVLLFPR